LFIILITINSINFYLFNLILYTYFICFIGAGATTRPSSASP